MRLNAVAVREKKGETCSLHWQQSDRPFFLVQIASIIVIKNLNNT